MVFIIEVEVGGTCPMICSHKNWFSVSDKSCLKMFMTQTIDNLDHSYCWISSLRTFWASTLAGACLIVHVIYRCHTSMAYLSIVLVTQIVQPKHTPPETHPFQPNPHDLIYNYGCCSTLSHAIHIYFHLVCVVRLLWRTNNASISLIARALTLVALREACGEGIINQKHISMKEWWTPMVLRDDDKRLQIGGFVTQ